MTVKDVTELYKSLEKRINNLETQISNHCGQHMWDKIVSYGQLCLTIVVILMLKFKVL
ncbi:hypothetical protein LCGC14_2217920 [marine sediment metagenome]|uniref:Uncharacterized protein n=1 Tax=marine sediment metagenome TaxID=412755 RepID=A0A0F9DBX9_9ZZZZ